MKSKNILLKLLPVAVAVSLLLAGILYIDMNGNPFDAVKINKMADAYADAYGLLKLAGSDNHSGARIPHLAGMSSETPVSSEADFCRRMVQGEMSIFTMKNPLREE